MRILSNPAVICTIIIVLFLITEIARIKNSIGIKSKRSARRSVTIKEANDILSFLRNTLSIDQIAVEEIGEAEDRILYTDETVKDIMKRAHNRSVSVLVFTSCISDEKNCTRLISMMRTLSMLDFDIDWVNDTHPTRRVNDVIALFSRWGIRCDNLLNYKDINVICLGEYDLIFHPRAGVRSAYEVTANLIKTIAARGKYPVDED